MLEHGWVMYILKVKKTQKERNKAFVRPSATSLGSIVEKIKKYSATAREKHGLVTNVADSSGTSLFM